MQYLIVVLVVMVVACTGWAAEVSSGKAKLVLDEKTGAIRSLTHAGREFAAGDGLYAIEFVEPAGSSTGATLVRTRNGEDGSLIVEAEHDKPFAFTVTCTFKPEGRFIAGRIALRTAQPCRIASVTFPVLRLTLPLNGAGADDAVVLPECDGATMMNPLANDLNRTLPYPGSASMQFMGAYDRTAGVYLASRDGEGYAKTLNARRQEKTLHLSIRHVLAQEPVTEWALPYDVVLTTYDVKPELGEGWEIAADLYRPWAIQQRWCKTTLAERFASGDLPQWLSEPSLFYAFTMHGRLPDGKDGMRTALVPEHAEAWRQVVGGPVTFMLMSWEKRGPWVAPDYFPPINDGDAFSAATRGLHEKGHRTLVFLSGLNWTLHKTQRGTFAAIDDQAAFDQSGRAHAISDAKGEPVIYGKPAEDVGQYARVCPTTPLADAMLRDTSLKCQEYGIDCVQADQLVGGGSPACSHPQHAHPRTGGNWSAKALYDAFARTREAGKAKSRDYAFSIEEPGELYLPLLDTYHARDYMQNRWPRWGAGAVGVPLFTHVYHDYCLGYGGDSTPVSSSPNAPALYAQAMNLVCGKAPGVCTWTSWLDPATVDAVQKRMLRSHFAMWRGPAHDYLVFGRRVTVPALSVPTMPITYTDWPSGKKTTLEMAQVLTAVYELPGGKRGRVLACIAQEPVTVNADGKAVRLEPGEATFHAVE